MIHKVFLLIGLTMSVAQLSVAIDLYNTPLGELRDVEDISIEALEELFAQSLAAEYELAAAIKAHIPSKYDGLVNAMIVSYGNDETIVEVTSGMRSVIDFQLRNYLIFADEQALFLYRQVRQPLLKTVQNAPSECLPLLKGNTQVMEKLALETDVILQDQLYALYNHVIQTSDFSLEVPSLDEARAELKSALTPMIEQYGHKVLLAIEHPAQLDGAESCMIMRDVYHDINELPKHEAAEIMRSLIILSPYD